MRKPPLKRRALILAALVLWALAMVLPVALSLRVTAA